MTADYRQAETVDALLIAADLLEVDGWRQLAYGPLDIGVSGCRCVFGGLAAATGVDPDERTSPAEMALARYLGLDVFTEVVSWNDAHERTAEEVVAALRGCASALFAESDVREPVTA